MDFPEGAPVSGIYASGQELLTSIEERPEQLPNADPNVFLEQHAHASRAAEGHPCHWCNWPADNAVLVSGIAGSYWLDLCLLHLVLVMSAVVYRDQEKVI
jgi:hypothetical protein